MAQKRGGLYIHVAYCRSKCKYCDFFSGGDRNADWRSYTDALIRELNSRINEKGCPFLTVYVGGGTPSLMPPGEFCRLADAIRPYATDAVEFTLEANPDDISEEMLRVWKDCGVNRLSIGIQTLDDELLNAIGRRHNSSTALRSYHLAREFFSNISVDLMFGLPGQTMEMWRKDVETTISLQPEHISAYTLMYEPGTVITVLRDSGRLSETSEDIVIVMYRTLVEELKKAGYEHYEISNFALSGYRSRHNSSYWTQVPYIGIGPSAHSYDGLRSRKANRPDLRGYLEGKDVSETEILTDDELREEYIMTRLRTREGIPLEDFKRRFGSKAMCVLIEKARTVGNEDLELRNGRIALTESSVPVSDAIMVELF